MSNPLVSVIVPTKNSSEFLEACLQSVKDQTYHNVELILVDNYSIDGTLEIAKRFTANTYSRGPERSAQRNFGVEQAGGEYVLIIDSDMVLTDSVIVECVTTASIDSKKRVTGIIIPEISYGIGFWAKCKSFERSFYTGNDFIEAARFFPTATYRCLRGFNEELVSGEDWEFTKRVRGLGKVARITSYIRHNEGSLNLTRTLKKKYYYAGQAGKYFDSVKSESILLNKSGPLYRYLLFLKHPSKLIKHPIIAFGMLIMKTLEYGAGGIGYIMAKL